MSVTVSGGTSPDTITYLPNCCSSCYSYGMKKTPVGTEVRVIFPANSIRKSARSQRGIITKRGALYLHDQHTNTWPKSAFTMGEVAWFRNNPMNHMLRIQHP
jgi:hypothetical protein